jgi:hypothetical protein
MSATRGETRSKTGSSVPEVGASAAREGSPGCGLVTVVLPCYRVADVVGEALHSVAGQTYSQWEMVAVLDGPDTALRNQLECFAGGVRQRVVIVEHPKNRGLPAARNTALETGTGEVFALLDSDDFWASDHLAALLETMTTAQADLVYSEVFVVRRRGGGGYEDVPVDTIEVRDPPRDLFRRNFVNPSAAAFTRRVFLKVGGFDGTLPCVADLDYWIRVCASGFKVAGTGRKTAYYVQAPGTLSARADAMAEEQARVLASHAMSGLLPSSRVRKLAAKSYAAAGRMFFRGAPERAAENFRKALALNPRQALSWIGWLASHGLSLLRRTRKAKTKVR